MTEKKIFVYVGSWTVQAKDNIGGGIGIYEYNAQDGSLRYIDTVRKDIVAGMMYVDQQRGVLYSVDEQTDYGMQGSGGRVVAFSINPETGALTDIGEQPSFSTLTSYVEQDGSGDWLVVVNHGDKKVITKYTKAENGEYQLVTDYSVVTAVLYPLAENGAIMPASDIQDFPVNRNTVPASVACLHTVRFAPDGAHCLITNMKQDEIFMYALDRENGKLVKCDKMVCESGSFPRYCAFHPEKKFIYLNDEHAYKVHTLSYDDDGKLKMLQTLDTTPTLEWDMTGKKVMQTDIKISADGKYVYDFYRGANCVMVFEVDEQTGLMKKIQEFSFGKQGNPRGFAISPDGKFILVADNDNHLVVTLNVNDDGTVALSGLADQNMKFPGNISFYSVN